MLFSGKDYFRISIIFLRDLSISSVLQVSSNLNSYQCGSKKTNLFFFLLDKRPEMYRAINFQQRLLALQFKIIFFFIVFVFRKYLFNGQVYEKNVFDIFIDHSIAYKTYETIFFEQLEARYEFFHLIGRKTQKTVR